MRSNTSFQASEKVPLRNHERHSYRGTVHSEFLQRGRGYRDQVRGKGSPLHHAVTKMVSSPLVWKNCRRAQLRDNASSLPCLRNPIHINYFSKRSRSGI